MSKPDMKFEHSYMTKEKVDANNGGVFTSTFKSYIADGTQALNDKTVDNMSRTEVISKVRVNLKQQMQEVNQNSYDAAVSMQQRKCSRCC